MSNTTDALTLAERVGDLVRIPSVNPLQAGPKSGDDDERNLSAWMADRADGLGADVTVDEVLEGRNNVYARFEGTTDRTLTIDVHLDTVGVEHMTEDPFDGRIADNRVYGRGSVDTKASLAIVLAVLEEMRAAGDKPVPTVNVVGTISEETGGLIGAAGFRDWLLERGQVIDQMIVAEPTMCAPVYGHKGVVGVEITVHGEAAHSSKPHLGKNAISGAARIIAAVDAEHARLEAQPPTPLGHASVAVLTADGGNARNIIPSQCNLYCGQRTVPGEDPDAVFEHLSTLARDAAAPLEVDLELAFGWGSPAFYQDPNADLVQRLGSMAGTEPEVATYGTNALQYTGGIAKEIAVFGPGSIDQAHKAVEWIDISEIERAANIYRSWFADG